jgi:hypothetical protein
MVDCEGMCRSRAAPGGSSEKILYGRRTKNAEIKISTQTFHFLQKILDFLKYLRKTQLN